MSKEFLVQLTVEQVAEYVVEAEDADAATAKVEQLYRSGDYGELITYSVVGSDAFEIGEE